MKEDICIRWKWLKFMYLYTIVGAGVLGMGMIIFPKMIFVLLGWPVNEPLALGIIGSTYLAFGILSIFGLWNPLKFVPILLLQLLYKSIWFLAIIFPLMIHNALPDYGIIIAVIFATYIIGDLIAIHFSYIFSKRSDWS